MTQKSHIKDSFVSHTAHQKLLSLRPVPGAAPRLPLHKRKPLARRLQLPAERRWLGGKVRRAVGGSPGPAPQAAPTFTKRRVQGGHTRRRESVETQLCVHGGTGGGGSREWGRPQQLRGPVLYGQRPAEVKGALGTGIFPGTYSETVRGGAGAALPPSPDVLVHGWLLASSLLCQVPHLRWSCLSSAVPSLTLTPPAALSRVHLPFVSCASGLFPRFQFVLCRSPRCMCPHTFCKY